MKYIAVSLAIALLLTGSLAAGAKQEGPPKPPDKKIGLWVAKDVAPAIKIRLNVNARNIPSLLVTAQKLSDPVAWFLSDDRATPPAVVVKPVGKWPMSMLNKGDRPTPYQV